MILSSLKERQICSNSQRHEVVVVFAAGRSSNSKISDAEKMVVGSAQRTAALSLEQATCRSCSLARSSDHLLEPYGISRIRSEVYLVLGGISPGSGEECLPKIWCQILRCLLVDGDKAEVFGRNKTGAKEN